MENKVKQKKLNRIVFAVFALVFCAFSFLFIPENFVSATNDVVESYESFDAALSDMIKTYDNDEEIAVQSLGAEEKEYNERRLIVYSDARLDSRGAVAKAEYNGYHIYQYQDAESARNAYDYYSNLSAVYNVSYDMVTTAGDFEVEEQTYSTNSYNSWADEYVGYSNYITTMLQICEEESLNKVAIAVIDSGIYAGHNLFKNRILSDYAKDFTGETGTTYAYQDLNGHGTHVSGTIAEFTLSNVKILPLKVLKSNGKGYVSYIVNAINYAIDLKSKNSIEVEKEKYNLVAMNMSVGVEGTASSNSSLTNVVQKAYNAGIMPVVSAGNGDDDGVRMDVTYSSPANVDCAIAVAALVRNKTFFGGYTLKYDSYSNYGEYVDFAAPGTYILSAGTSSSTSVVAMSGTSMAAPHVTACVALIYSNPNFAGTYSLADTYNLLAEHAVDMGIEGRDDDYGYGLISIGDVGIETVGDLTFSCEEDFPTSAFDLSISYDKNVGDNTLKIYYTTDAYATMVDSSSTLYVNPIHISESTKVTAMAFVYNSKGNLVQRSNVKTFTYYFNNYDILSNYEYIVNSDSVTITKYKGNLSVLNVPETISSKNVVCIDGSAFKNATVKVVNLPQYIKSLNNSCFYGCSTLEEIYLNPVSQVAIGGYAFRNCSKLKIFEISNIESVGEYAFADCSSLTKFELPKVTKIGVHAFSNSGVNTLVLGKKLSNFGNQTFNKSENITIYGYKDTVAETFAASNNIQFVDLSLKITKDLNSRIIVKEGQNCQFTFEYHGYNVGYTKTFSGYDSQFSAEISSLSEYDSRMTINLKNLSVGEYTLYLTIRDQYDSSIKSNTIYVDVVDSSTETYAINFEEGDFVVKVDGEEISSGAIFYKGFEYQIKVTAKDGYDLKKVSINGVEKGVNETFKIALTENVQIDVQTSAKNNLTVSFNTSSNGVAKIGGTIATSKSVSRNGSVAFSVEANVGYTLKKVTANGTLLTANSDGLYVIEDIVTDINVEITFAEAYYKISVVQGKGGDVSSSGGSFDSVAHGSSRIFILSPSEGYKVDFVSVNGQKISVQNNKFSIDNIDQDCEVVILFKKETSIFSENGIVMVYFMIFLGIFIVFIIAKVALHFIRKERNKI